MQTDPEKLSLWRISPSASHDDPRWLDHVPVEEALVLARSAAEARLLVAQETTSSDMSVVGNESANNHSRLYDEKLYRVEHAQKSELHERLQSTDRAQVVRLRRSGASGQSEGLGRE